MGEGAVNRRQALLPLQGYVRPAVARPTRNTSPTPVRGRRVIGSRARLGDQHTSPLRDDAQDQRAGPHLQARKGGSGMRARVVPRRARVADGARGSPARGVPQVRHRQREAIPREVRGDRPHVRVTGQGGLGRPQQGDHAATPGAAVNAACSRSHHRLSARPRQPAMAARVAQP